MVTSILPMTATGLTVSKRGKRLIGPIDLTLDDAGLTILMGPNGSGKTTLLRAIHGLERLKSGHVDWAVPQSAAFKHQSYVFQRPIMMRRTVQDNLAYPLTLTGTPKQDISHRVTTWLDRIGLAHAADRMAPRLSGGEKQKLALARALIRNPQVLFLDEPCANLDGRATREIEAILIEARAQGTRIIMATHDMGQARRLADDVLFLHHGTLHDQGPAETFFTGPKTPEATAFLKGEIVE